jgi:hypothetical protein
MDENARFRIFFWQKLTPLLTLPVFALFVVVSPLTDGWGRTTWWLLGGAAGTLVALYLLNAWRRASVRLDHDGLTLYLVEGLQTWPYAKLLKVKQIGRYRVRMCFDPDVPDRHMHISIDLLDSDRFVEELLDRYAETMGHELREPDTHEAA